MKNILKGQKMSLSEAYNRKQHTRDFSKGMKGRQELDVLFQFLLQIDKILCIKKVGNADFQTIAYFLDCNDASIQAFAVGNAFNCALWNSRFITERIGGESLFSAQIIDS